MSDPLNLPQLVNLAYSVDDDSEHEGGGVCAALLGDSEDEMRIALINQYLSAIRILAESIGASTNDWTLGRPLVFLAHHLVEVSLKAAIEGRGASVPRSHDLPTLTAVARSAGCFEGVSAEASAWYEDLSEQVNSITGDGTPGRFFDGKVGGAAIDQRWCCLNVDLIVEATGAFAELCVADVMRCEAEAIPSREGGRLDDR
ncbi:hypothetical protein [uncultured Microbacterium sp.]|uniref:hypothetical protein n=1 Tax=uncultured Microbacterium sp. TaxID=191216 RepID=UPI0025FE6D73|nr:hypothetical protein [uncultured Microbacterium sp.]